MKNYVCRETFFVEAGLLLAGAVSAHSDRAADESVIDLNKMFRSGKHLQCCNHPSSGTSA
jgi:hypothetical protein